MHLTTVTLANIEEAKAFLAAVGVVGPSLHPDINSESAMKRWNGWNYTVASGIDADGLPVALSSWHYASGHVDYSTAIIGDTPYGSTLAFQNIAFPVEALPAVARILHPKHTPTSQEV